VWLMFVVVVNNCSIVYCRQDRPTSYVEVFGRMCVHTYSGTWRKFGESRQSPTQKMCWERICVSSSGACRPNVPTFGCRANMQHVSNFPSQQVAQINLRLSNRLVSINHLYLPRRNSSSVFRSRQDLKCQVWKKSLICNINIT